MIKIKEFQISNFKFQISNKNVGFTLIELLVVIAIMGVLAVGVMILLNPSTQFQRSNDVKRKGDLAQLQRALELYYQDHAGYPTSSAGFLIQNPAALAWGASFQPYMSLLPKDPLSTHTYVYYSPNTQTYYLYANLERGSKDTQVCNAGAACVTLGTAGFPAANACGATCNFAVTSANVTP